MSEARTPSGKRPFNRQAPADLPRLDSERAGEEVRRFVDLAIREMALELQYDISTPAESAAVELPAIIVAFRGSDEELLLAQQAELLLALEHIAHRWLRLDPRLHDQIRFDCGDYRATHLDELKLSARVAAQRVRETGQAFRFNPMSARERRIIHLELTGAQGVRTLSEGTGDRRQLVIYPLTNTKK
ncbi:MAG: R3H domain-containing nucleic acid-binding protein [Candidatus Acidiferrales bacterium]